MTEETKTKSYAIESEWQTLACADSGEVLRGLSAVQSAIGAIPKDGRNPEFGYAFRSAEAIMSALQPLLAKNQIVLIPRLLDVQSEQYPTRNGGTMKFVRVLVSYRFASALDGSSIETITGGEGADTQDKALNKAMTGALKNCINQTFTIPSELDDSEAADHSGDEQVASTASTASTAEIDAHRRRTAAQAGTAAPAGSVAPAGGCQDCRAPEGRPHATNCGKSGRGEEDQAQESPAPQAENTATRTVGPQAAARSDVAPGGARAAGGELYDVNGEVLAVPDGGWPPWIGEKIPMGKYKGETWASILGHSEDGEHANYANWAGEELDRSKGTAGERYAWIAAYYGWLYSDSGPGQ